MAEWFPAEIPSNVAIGKDVYLHGSFAFANYTSTRPVGLRIGNDSTVYDLTSFHLGPDAEVEIGSFTLLQGAVISTNSRVSIGSFVFVSGEVFIADRFCPISPRDPDYAARGRSPDHRGSQIVIGDDCWLGIRSAVLGGASLGRGVIVGAGTVVDFEVPAYAIVAGNPGRIVGWSRPRRSGDLS